MGLVLRSSGACAYATVVNKKMGKKQKGGKGKKEKTEDGLPPPPSLDNYREGAREALLTFK